MPLPPTARLGRVRLRVGRLDRALAFYCDLLGLAATPGHPGSVSLAATAGGPAILGLDERPGARPKPAATTGLFHVALLVPDRSALARIVVRLTERRWPLQGTADHAVSEAIYLADPDGNGLEIYADRPREAWRHHDGELYMTTEPLDLESLLGELDWATEEGSGLDERTTVGHVHLRVGDLDEAEAFYAGVLGFDVTVRNYPGALFLSAGGYHHHVGVNTWAGPAAARPPADAAGLVEYELLAGDEEGVDAVRARARGAGLEPAPAGDGWRVEDPDGNAVVVRAGSAGGAARNGRGSVPAARQAGGGDLI